MRCTLIAVLLILCCGYAQAANNVRVISSKGSQQKDAQQQRAAKDAQREAKREAERRAAVARFRAQVDEANRLAGLKAVKENTPLIHGWTVKVDKNGKPSKVPQTWPNLHYRR